MLFSTRLLAVSLVSFLFMLGLAISAAPDDKVTYLPGFEGPLPSNHYSGYVPVGSLTSSPGQLHYWFIESENADSAATDPIVLWLNGGPGSSSLIGLLTENGQVRTNDDSITNPTAEGIPRLSYNNYSWSKLTNMLYLESPKGVGFSYCDEAVSKEDCQNSDESTALDAYEFLVNWFAVFPEYKQNEFYITGESYAGIYIPMLMKEISEDSLGAGINLIGAAIGNGCWGTTVGTCAHGVEQQEYASAFFFGHGMYSSELRAEMLQPSACGDWTELNEECSAKLDEMNEQMGDFDVYNIYDECGEDNRRRRLASSSTDSSDSSSSSSNNSTSTSTKKKTRLSEVAAAMAKPTITVSTADSFSVSAGYSQTLNDYECGGHTAMNEYLAEPSVMEALHVFPGTVGMTYSKTCGDLLPLYSELIDKYRILIYSGDVDGCVPYTGTEQWTRALNYSVVQDWHQWFAKPAEFGTSHSNSDSSDGGGSSGSEAALHKAGYAVTFDKFQFITINGAGHEVPTFQPGFAYEMYRRFLAGETF